MEFGDDLAGIDQVWYTSLDRRDRNGLRFRAQVAADCHYARDCSSRRDPLKVLSIGLFGPSSTGRPLADDAERASEATRGHASPKLSTISTAGRPLIVEPWQMRVQRTLPGPENIVPFAADHLPDQLPAIAGLAHDLLDGDAVLRQSQDGRIGLFAAKIAPVLEALSGWEQFGTGVLQPTISALPSRQSFGGQSVPNLLARCFGNCSSCLEKVR